MPINNAVNRVSQTGAPMGVYTENQSWTPTIFGSTTAGTGTYTTQQGYYTRIGALLYVTGYLVWTSHTGSGKIRLSLPFPVRNQANYNPVGPISLEDVQLPGGSSSITLSFSPGTSEGIPRSTRSNNTSLEVNMDSTGTINFSGVYLL